MSVRNYSDPEEHRISDRASSPCPRYPKKADFGLLFKIDRSKEASSAGAGIHLDGYGFGELMLREASEEHADGAHVSTTMTACYIAGAGRFADARTIQVKGGSCSRFANC